MLNLTKGKKQRFSYFFSQNIFVSYDMEHFEEDEDRTPNGKKHTFFKQENTMKYSLW